MKDPQKVYADLDKGIFENLYLFFGEETFFIDEALMRIKKSVLPIEAIDFNFSSYDAREQSLAQVLEEAMTLPVFAQRRLVFLKDVQDLKEKEWTQFADYLKNPSESTVLVLTASKIDKRKKVFKQLFDKALTVEFRKPFEYQIPQWIKYLAQSQDLKITDDARQFLHRQVGSHLVELRNEIVKLKEFVESKSDPAARTSIEIDDVKQVVSSSREESIFEFTKAIGRMDRVAALESLARLLEQGQNEMGVVALLARHMRILVQVKSGQEQGFYGGKLAEKVQLPPYFLEEYAGQAGLWSTKKLHHVLEILSDTDRALKSSPVSSHIWLENLVLQSCEA